MIPKGRKIKKGSTFQNIFFPILMGILFFGIIGFLVISNLRINQKRGEMLGKIDLLKAEIQTLEEKKKELEAGISQTGQESYWEEKAREQGYKKPGEEAIVVLPPQEEKATSTEEQKNFLEKILQKLGF